MTSVNGCCKIDHNTSKFQAIDRNELSFFVVWQHCSPYNIWAKSKMPPETEVNTPTASSPLACIGCFLKILFSQDQLTRRAGCAASF
jgi:hypothetical protein